MSKKWSEKEIREEIRKKGTNGVSWGRISGEGDISESFIREYATKIKWQYLVFNQQLSNDFVREFKHKFIDWTTISRGRQFSEQFIEEMRDKINWYIVFEVQNLSEQFLDKWSGESYNNIWYLNVLPKNVSKDFILKYKDYFSESLKEKYRYFLKQYGIEL